MPSRKMSLGMMAASVSENEHVVAAALADIEFGKHFNLVAALPAWHRRGRSVGGIDAKQAAKLVRVSPELDRMNGFFVALFARTSSRADRARRLMLHRRARQAFESPAWSLLRGEALR